MSITIRKGAGTPTTNTAGFIGEIYEDTNTGNRYECTGMYKTTGAKSYGPDCDYIWEKVDMIEEKRIPGNSGGLGVMAVVFSYDEYVNEDGNYRGINYKLEYGDVVITEFLEVDSYNIRITSEQYAAFVSFLRNNPCLMVKRINTTCTDDYTELMATNGSYALRVGNNIDVNVFNIVNPDGDFI